MYKASADMWLILGIFCCLLGTLLSILCVWHDEAVPILIGNLIVIGIVEILGSEILKEVTRR